MTVDIAPRSAWSPRYGDGEVDLSGLAVEVFAHHTVTAQLPPTATVEQECEQMRAIEQVGHDRFARDEVPNAGISYNVLIFPSGRAYQGVSWNRRGAHTDGRNSTTRSICFVGNYEEHEPTPAQLATAAAIYAEGKGRWWWPSAPLRGHRDLKQTACPGRHVYAQLPAIAAGTITPPGGFMADLTTEQQQQLVDQVTATLTVAKQIRTKTDRLEKDEAERRTANLKHQRASAAREVQLQKEIAGLTEAVKTLAANQGLPVEQMLDVVREAIEGITVTVAAD